MMRPSVLVVAVALSVGACGKKTPGDDKPTEGSAVAVGSSSSVTPAGSGTEDVGSGSAAAPVATHPLVTQLGFVDTALAAEVGQFAFAPNDARLKSAVGGAAHEKNVLNYGVVELAEIGSTTSKVKGLSGETSVPNAFIIPIPRGQTVATGDLVVASRHGNTLDHAIVTDVSTAPGKANWMNAQPFDKPHEGALKPDQFFKLDGTPMQPGSIIAKPDGRGGWEIGILVRVEGDKALVHGHMGKMEVRKPSDLRAVPVKTELKAGDNAFVVWSTISFREAKVTGVDGKLGVYTVEFPPPFNDKTRKQYAPFGSVAPAKFE